jgi:hypothetical protein
VGGGENRPLCRNRLLLDIDTAPASDLAVETLFFSRRLSFRRLLLVDWRREAVSQLLWSDKDREVWFFLEKNHEKVYRSPDFLQRGTS